MRSKANIKSHPIHPMLIVFPIAFFTGTFLCDVYELLTKNNIVDDLIIYLNIAAIVSALLAAVPGIIDYIYTIPPDSSAKKRGTKHALLNVSNILLFTGAYFLRSDGNTLVIVGMETIGMIFLTIAGWHGGTLVYRNQIGVDPRYADAGKWNEEYITSDNFPVKVASTDELSVNQMKLIHVKGLRIVIGKTEKGFVAFNDRCSHKGGSLAGGSMICGTVQCPWHGTQFNVETGQVTAGPATTGIPTYRLTEENGSVLLHL